ncbi:MAG: aminotransferase class V-fold PLP-dependent enzyme [Thermomicrobiales bacterium]
MTTNRETIDEIRSGIPPLARYVWFQNGGVSVTPRPIADEHARLMNELYERGPMHIVYPDEEYPRRAETICRLARFFHVQPDEIALMRGVSEAFQTVLRGIEWQKGDRLLISADEEEALLLAALHLRDVEGVEVLQVPLEADPHRQLEAFTDRINNRTRLIAFSHVTTDLGYRLPAERICALANDHGCYSFVDLAHSAGLFPIDLRAMGCDFAGILSYKWMYSPYAAGLLYIRKDRIDDLRVIYAGGRAEAWLDYDSQTYELHDSAERFQFGPWSWPLVHTWAFAADWLTELGVDSIWERTAHLTGMLKRGLQEIDGARLLTPEHAEDSAALVSLDIEGWDGTELTSALRQNWNIMIKPVPHGRPGVRTSLPFFLLEDEVETLLDALERPEG